jgi:hypothetical protein
VRAAPQLGEHRKRRLQVFTGGRFDPLRGATYHWRLRTPLTWWAGLPTHNKVLLAAATTVLVVELVFRRVAPRSKAYRKWKAAFEFVGSVWTGVILSVVYFTTVSLIGIAMKVLGKDPLDRTLAAEPTFWHAHEPNPLGAAKAVRHQF